MKKLLAVLLAVAMLLSFAACGAKNEAPANTDAVQNSAAPVDTSDFKVGDTVFFSDDDINAAVQGNAKQSTAKQ